MHIIIIGPPGCGKGTISKKIESDFKVKHVSTGDLLRNTDDTEIKEALKGGNFVSDDLITRLVHEEIKKTPRCLLDGYPRTLDQTGNIDVKIVLLVKTNDQVCIERIQGRKDKREDDRNIDVIKKRLVIYHERTEPVIQLYREKGLVEEIDGNGSADEVYMRVKEILTNKL